MDIILIFGCNCRKGLIFHFLYRLSLLNFDLNGAAELPAVRGLRGRGAGPPGRGGPSGTGQARREEGSFGRRARPVGMVRRWDKGLPTGRRQHGPAASGIRGVLLAWPDGGLRLCRRGGANMGLRRVGFGAPCWRGPTVGQGVVSGVAPTWACGERDSRRPVGVTRRWIKALPTG